MSNVSKKSEVVSVSNSNSDKKLRYAELIETHSHDLYKYALWLCKDKLMAEDVMQETYLRAWKSLDSLREEKAAKGWLFTIFRREHARQFERKQLPYQELDSMDSVADGRMGYDDRPEAFALRNALNKLPSDYREPLEMQVLAGFSCEEISRILNISPSAVMTRLFRARKRMRNLLGQEDAEGIGLIRD